MNVHAPSVEGRILIGGELVASESGAWLESINPATEEPIGRAPAASAADMNRAKAAEKAFPAWAARDVRERGSLVRGAR